MADFLIPGKDDVLLNEMVKIYEFDTEPEREQFIAHMTTEWEPVLGTTLEDFHIKLK